MSGWVVVVSMLTDSSSDGKVRRHRQEVYVVPSLKRLRSRQSKTIRLAQLSRLESMTTDLYANQV